MREESLGVASRVSEVFTLLRGLLRLLLLVVILGRIRLNNEIIFDGPKIQ